MKKESLCMKKESLRIYRTDHRPEAEYLLIEPWVQYNVNYYNDFEININNLNPFFAWAAVKFIDPDDFFAIPGINSATYNGKKFKTVFKETISKDFDDPIKTYTKKINAAIVKASE